MGHTCDVTVLVSNHIAIFIYKNTCYDKCTHISHLAYSFFTFLQLFPDGFQEISLNNSSVINVTCNQLDTCKKKLLLFFVFLCQNKALTHARTVYSQANVK